MPAPLAILAATTAGANLIERIASPSTKAASTASSSFDQAYADSTRKAFEKLFANDPSLKAKLGEGPYTLTQSPTDGTLTLSSQTTGKSVALDQTTQTGQTATSLANSVGLKNFKKGLELQAV